jgi:hypothetical protein
MSVADGGVYMMGSDNGGWCASVDGATSFANANSGRLFSNRKCGGYDAAWYKDDKLSPEVAQGYGDCPVSEAEDLRPFAEGGPPTALAGFQGLHSNANDTVSGPAPAQLATPACAALCQSPNGASGCAQDVIYAVSTAFSYFSPDAARQWFPLRPQCQMHKEVTYKAVAADAGKAGHLVMLASDYEGHGTSEASGCIEKDGFQKCARRAIAWTEDVGPELEASILATTFADGKTLVDGKRRFERAGGGGAGEDPLKPDAGSTAPDADTSSGDGSSAGGSATESKYELTTWSAQPKWRFASIANLPAPAQIGGTCRILDKAHPNAEVITEREGTVVADAATCRADESQNCHGRLASEYMKPITQQSTTFAPEDRDAWCLNFADAGCKCTAAPDTVCRYPTPEYLEIDPRNGWAYLSTDVGLLTSPDGGGHWIREGQGPASNPADNMVVGTGGDAYAPSGAQLLTGQFNVATAGAAPEDPGVYDLQKTPDRIRSIGRMSLAFTPCPGGASAPMYSGSTRKRGHLVAALPVDWIAPNGQRRSSVFVATEPANCDPGAQVPAPSAMVFADSADHDRS